MQSIRNEYTLEACKAKILATEALDKLDPIDNDWSAQNMGQSKDVRLLQSGSWLTGKTEHEWPIIQPLVIIQAEVHTLNMHGFIGLPATVEPEGKKVDTFRLNSLWWNLSTSLQGCRTSTSNINTLILYKEWVKAGAMNQQ